MNIELIIFILYFIIVLGIGLFFFFKTRRGGEKEYFLGDRKLGGFVAALSAGASDMSSWVLMGLPASTFAFGLGKIWIAVGLAAGTVLSWLFIAPRLRRFSIAANDSITLPQYLTNRFKSKSKILRIICAVIFLTVYAIYAASSIKACGTLFNIVMGLDTQTAMYIAAGVIVLYTFLGGFSAVCWTDFFQGLLMLFALITVPVAALVTSNGSFTVLPPDFLSIVPHGILDYDSISGIITGLGWGLGYFGMPHIIIRYMAIKSPVEVKKSRIIGSAWTILILVFSVASGLIGRAVLGEIDDSSLVFITMVRRLFPAAISGILLSAILAASMSTADSQLLASASAFASDVYKPLLRKNASDREMLWVGRIVVAVITAAALFIAISPNSGSIMDLVENAWGIFGAAFGPVILLSLFMRDFTFKGAVVSIAVGGICDILWLVLLSGTGIYEIIPGFILGLAAGIIVSKCAAPSKAAQEVFDAAMNYKD